MGYSVDAVTDNCYEGTSCLINKFNIRDEKKLIEVESDIVFGKTLLLENLPLEGDLNFEYYLSIHKFLFEELYDWAGKLRNINISKKGTVFCPVEQLEEHCKNCFSRLAENNYFLNLPREKLVDEVVDFYCSTNMLHPFREGNGRTQRIFISKLVKQCGYEFNLSSIDEDDLMIATIQAANGVKDYLIELFNKTITKTAR